MTPALVDYLRRNHERYDAIVFFSYRYWTTYFGMQVAPAQEPAGAHRGARPRPLPAPVPGLLQAPGGDRLQHAGGARARRARDRQPRPSRRGGRHRDRAPGRDPGGRGGAAARPPGRLLRLRRPHRAREGLRRDDRPLPALAARDARDRDARALRPQHDELLGERARPADGRRPRRREARGDRPRARARDAVAPREPVDGGARGVDDAAAGPGERRLRGAARPGAARRRRPLLPPLRGVRGGDGHPAAAAARSPTAWAGRARPTSRRTTPGRA